MVYCLGAERRRQLLLLPLCALLALPVGSAGARPTPVVCGFQVTLGAAPQTGPTPLVVRFTASATAGTPDFYNWSFGDGSGWNDTGATVSTPLHRYPQAGNFLVQVWAGEPGCTATMSLVVQATPAPLVVAVTARPSNGTVPLTVSFGATVSGGTGTYTSAVWEFGDGGVGSGLNLTYTYLQAGNFTAVVNVTDTAGHWARSADSVRVDPPPATPAGSGSSILQIVALLGAGTAVAAGVAFVAYRRRSLRHLAQLPPNAPILSSTGPTPVLAGVTGSDPATLGAPIPPAPTGGGSAIQAAAPEPLAPVPLAPMPSAGEPPSDRRRLSEQVLLHIGNQGRLGASEVAPAALTQAGISTSLRTTQGAVTNVLRRLRESGAITDEVRHVRGSSRRLRVYILTPRGEEVYRELRSRPSQRLPSGPGP